MTATATRNFESQPSPEEEGISISSFIPVWGCLGFLVLAMVCIVGTPTALKKIRRVCCSSQPRDRPAAPPTSNRSTDVSGRFVEMEVANERISNAEIEALLNHNNVSGLRTEPLTIVDNHLPVPNRHTSVSPLAPSAIPSTTDLSALPPSYRQISVSSPHHRELQHSEQTLVTQLGPSASPPSYNQLLVSNEHHRELQHSATHALSRLLAPTTCTRPSTETNIRRHLVEDPAQRSWRSYFNTADRLRELTGISPTHATFNETNVTPTCHQPRPQTPPPMYHEVEQTVARIARSDGLPSYDEFMATPSLVWYPCPSTNI